MVLDLWMLLNSRSTPPARRHERQVRPMCKHPTKRPVLWRLDEPANRRWQIYNHDSRCKETPVGKYKHDFRSLSAPDSEASNPLPARRNRPESASMGK